MGGRTPTTTSSGGRTMPTSRSNAWRGRGRQRNAPDGLIDHDIVEAAYANSLLRSLFPLISHGTLQFSRCTRSPWSYDVPTPVRLLGGGWKARPAPQGRDIPDRIAQTPEEAVVFVVGGLPDGCGPAVEGPAGLLLEQRNRPLPDRSPTPRSSLRTALMETR
ncbi:DUF6193 family natural product biosynthesis protein [Streptomyces sp900116325]|uniref:DUF6193 family natural product biosynthesis protein n=1 Tax=Streptomyces sp. 900116325 TaxID=3154295 RepID=UPI0033187015